MSVLPLATPLPPARSPASSKRRPPWWLLIVLLLAASGGGWAWREQDRVSLARAWSTARAGDIEDAVTALGKLQPRDYVDVGAQVSGQLKRLAVQVGDHVDAGALLAEIDPQLQTAKLELDRAQLEQLEADRAAQQVQVELTAAQFERQVQLRGQGATQGDVFDQKQSDMRVARAKLKSIDAQIRAARSLIKSDAAQLGFTRIYAPMSGTVVSIEARPGQTLIASQQVPQLLRIADLSSMTVWAHVSEADIPRLQIGMDVYFTTLGYGDRRWTAKLSRILPAAPKAPGQNTVPGVATTGANNVVLYTALFDVDNAADELRPEMSAQVYFVVAQAKAAVLVPVAALADSDKTKRENSVTVVAPDMSTEARAIQLGIRNRFDVQVLAGLQAGEKFALPPRNAAGGAEPSP